MHSIQCLFLAGSVLLVGPQIASSQDTPPNQDNLYAIALFSSLDNMAKDWGGIDDSSDYAIRIDDHRMVVEKDDVTESLPDSLGAYSVDYLDADELIARYRKLRNKFAILRIHPIKNNGAQLRSTSRPTGSASKKRR